MTRAEQETIFRYAADEAIVSIFTAFLPAKRKLERAGYQPVKVSRQNGREVGWFYRVPLAEFRWRVGQPRPPRPLTEAKLRQLAEAREARARRRQGPA